MKQFANKRIESILTTSISYGEVIFKKTHPGRSIEDNEMTTMKEK
jgi:hypothetical protein